MCGILGVVACAGRAPSVADRHAVAMRDTMTHRGPDGSGLARLGGAVLAHRRLAVMDPSPAGAQPMATEDGLKALVYNGEIYNDAELRRDLEREGVRFRSGCDTETLMRALERWGTGALPRLRGMFAFAWYDAQADRLLLARDPLGIKPLYVATAGREVVFASEPGAILAHPYVSPAPDLAMLAAYLTTIRTTLAGQTLFEGVVALPPGHVLTADMSGDEPALTIDPFWSPAPVGEDRDEGAAATALRGAIEDSVARHLRADVPVCALLSGGIDSAVTATLAARAHGGLRTYCAGARTDSDDDDFAHARRVAGALGTTHGEAVVDGDSFVESWRWMVDVQGVPLSTPNEVAIHAVAARLRADGCVVTISGEGADELLAGYAAPLDAAGRAASDPALSRVAPGRAAMAASAWVQPSTHDVLLTPEVSRAIGGGEALASLFDQVYEECAIEAGDRAERLDASLRMLRRINLTGLLQRLDSATMLASVEGRTPFADVRLAEVCEAMPLGLKYEPPPPDGGGTAIATAARTKKVLRRATADLVPAHVLEREKASFPLPFREWVGGMSETLRRSPFAKAVFNESAIERIAADPRRHWRLAWPVMNLALWGDRWW